MNLVERLDHQRHADSVFPSPELEKAIQYFCGDAPQFWSKLPENLRCSELVESFKLGFTFSVNLFAHPRFLQGISLKEQKRKSA